MRISQRTVTNTKDKKAARTLPVMTKKLSRYFIKQGIRRLTQAVLTCPKCNRKCKVIDVHNETYAYDTKTVVTEQCPVCGKKYIHSRSPAFPKEVIDKLPKEPEGKQLNLLRRCWNER